MDILSPVKPCVKCGSVERRANNGRCIPCEKAQSAKRYLKNKECVADSQRARIAANPQKRRETVNKWRFKHKEDVAKKQSIYNKTHKDRLDAARKLWAASNKERAAETRAKWIAANKDVRASYNHTRRAMRIAAGGKLSTNIVKRLLALQKGLCPCCGGNLGDKYHLDHITPLYLGGTNTDDNVQLLRAECNLQKSRKHPIDFMQSRGFLL